MTQRWLMLKLLNNATNKAYPHVTQHTPQTSSHQFQGENQQSSCPHILIIIKLGSPIMCNLFILTMLLQ